MRSMTISDRHAWLRAPGTCDNTCALRRGTTNVWEDEAGSYPNIYILV